MKLKIKFYRTAKIPAKFIVAAVGAEPDATPEIIVDKLMRSFKPLAPGIVLYHEGNKYIVAKEVMAFDLRQTNTPFAPTVVNCDPGKPEDIHRTDGALQSELARMGIMSEPKDYEWRSIVLPDGN